MALSSLQDEVYRAIKDQVISGRWRSGQRLSEERLAAELSVNRNPVREALIMLSGEGLLERSPGRGCRIAQIDITTVTSNYQLREAVEGMAARLTATRINSLQIFELKKEHELMQYLSEPKDRSAHAEADNRFHRMIILSSDNPSLLQVWDQQHLRALSAENLLIPRSILKKSGHRLNLDVEFGSHERIINAIQSGDPDASEAEVRHHVRQALKNLQEVIPVSETH